MYKRQQVFTTDVNLANAGKILFLLISYRRRFGNIPTEPSCYYPADFFLFVDYSMPPDFSSWVATKQWTTISNNNSSLSLHFLVSFAPSSPSSQQNYKQPQTTTPHRPVTSPTSAALQSAQKQERKRVRGEMIIAVIIYVYNKLTYMWWRGNFSTSTGRYKARVQTGMPMLCVCNRGGSNRVG